MRLRPSVSVCVWSLLLSRRAAVSLIQFASNSMLLLDFLANCNECSLRLSRARPCSSLFRLDRSHCCRFEFANITFAAIFLLCYFNLSVCARARACLRVHCCCAALRRCPLLELCCCSNFCALVRPQHTAIPNGHTQRPIYFTQTSLPLLT